MIEQSETLEPKGSGIEDRIDKSFIKFNNLCHTESVPIAFQKTVTELLQQAKLETRLEYKEELLKKIKDENFEMYSGDKKRIINIINEN